MKARKENPRTKREELEKIGGKIWSYYERLEREIDKANKNVLRLWKVLDLPMDIQLYLETNFCGQEVARERYMEIEYQKFCKRLENGDKDAQEDVLRYQSKLTPNNVRGQIMKRASRQYKEILSNAHISRCDQNSRSPEFDYFGDCLFLDKDEGLLIDGQWFLQKYDSITVGMRSECHKRQEMAVKAMNDFFERYQITWEEIKRYFDISGGRLIINKKSENKIAYMRIQG